MYKLVAIDLDGTLLNSEKKISQENKRALSLAIEKGIKVVICSGRIFSGARVYALEVGAKGPIIACNGAIIRDLGTGELLYSNTMDNEDCYKVIDICHSEDIYFHVYIGDTMYTEKLGFSSLLYSQRNRNLPKEDRVDIRVTDDLKNVLKSGKIPATKFVAISKDPEQLLRARKLVEQINGVQVMSSNYDNFEVVNSGVGKGTALKYLAEKLEIDREKVVAIGDNENDQSMLNYAGLSIAMENGESYIKEMADYVTLTNNENGVAHAVKKFLF